MGERYGRWFCRKIYVAIREAYVINNIRLIKDIIKNEKVDFEGQCLHARKIGFIHPKTNEYIEFTSELPDYFKKYLKKLENISSH